MNQYQRSMYVQKLRKGSIVSTGFSLPQGLLAETKAVAKRQRVSASSLVRNALILYLINLDKD